MNSMYPQAYINLFKFYALIGILTFGYLMFKLGQFYEKLNGFCIIML